MQVRILPGAPKFCIVILKDNNMLSRRYPDITFLDTITFRPKCTFNQCIEKFKLCENYVQSSKPPRRGRPIVQKPVFVYACSECGRKVQESEQSIDNLSIGHKIDDDVEDIDNHGMADE